VSTIAVVTPTWGPDAELFDELHRSVLEHTPQDTIHHVIVSPAYKPMFTRYTGRRCRIWTHPELLPRRYIRTPGGMWVNLRRPWPPVRGWVMQQAAKIAMSATVGTDVVLLADSDAILVRPVTPETLISGNTIRLYRADNAVHAGMPRHILWHNIARRLLGLPGTVNPPLPDYINPINIWSPSIVRDMQTQITNTTGRHWLDAFTSQLHISEFILYGVYLDQVRHDNPPPPQVDNGFCLHYYERTPMDTRAAIAFADRLQPDTIGIMISSHSGTPREVRQLAARRCAEALG
jgi:Family of unknown function (DUF6492)